MIYLCGDIHGDAGSLALAMGAAGVARGNVVVLLGDAGLNYHGNDLGDRSVKRCLEETGAHFLCVHGNHEKRPAGLPYYHLTRWRGGEVWVEDEFPDIFFARDGEVFELDGNRAIVMGGAWSADKRYRLAHGLPWFADEQPSAEIKSRVEKRLEELDWKVDIVLSHTCPAKYVPADAFLQGIDPDTADRTTEEWLDGIEERLSYSAWYCGHWHIDRCAEKLRFLYRGLACLSRREGA